MIDAMGAWDEQAEFMRRHGATEAKWVIDPATKLAYLESLTLAPLPPPKDEERTVTTQQSQPTADEEQRRREEQRRVALAASGGVRLRPEFDR